MAHGFLASILIPRVLLELPAKKKTRSLGQQENIGIDNGQAKEEERERRSTE